jgi:hypothetical protein
MLAAGDDSSAGGQDGITTYTVIVRGRHFELSRAQVLFDAPNYFSNAFLGSFTEARTRTLSLDRNPELFALVVEYLSGYTILPIEPRSLPPTMGVDTALRNLRTDADFFDLRALSAQLQISPTPPPTPPRSPTPEPNMLPPFAPYFGVSFRTLSLEEMISGRLPDDVVWSDQLGLVNGQGSAVLVRARNLGVR